MNPETPRNAGFPDLPRAADLRELRTMIRTIRALVLVGAVFLTLCLACLVLMYRAQQHSDAKFDRAVEANQANIVGLQQELRSVGLEPESVPPLPPPEPRP